MVSSGTLRLLPSTVWTSITWTSIAAIALLQPLQAHAQQTLPEEPGQVQPIDLTDPNNMRPLTQKSSYLSFQGGKRLMAEAADASSSDNYTLAAQKLQEARQIFNQLSNFYQQLAASFSGVDNRLADEQRSKARDTAQMRDEATYQLALVHRAQSQPELAVPLLVQIIRSQAPTRDLGKKAYQQLLELGFVDTPFPRPSRDAQPTSSTPAAPTTPATASTNPPIVPR